MSEMIQLVRDYPVGSLFLALCIVWAIERVLVAAFTKRSR